MSSTTIVTTWADLYTALLNDVRTETTVTATLDKAKRYIDEAHQWIYVAHGEKFHWAEKRAYIVTQPEYTTGTVTAAVGSGILTGSSTAWNTANTYGINNVRVGGKLVISGEDEVYTVTAVATDTSLLFTPNYIGTAGSGLSYRYFEDEYALESDFAKPIDAQTFDDNRKIRFVGRTRFRELYPRNRITCTTINVATWQDHPESSNTTPIRKVRFGPAPSNRQAIPYSYVTKNIVVDASGTRKASFTATTDEPIMPLRYRPIIVMGAKMHWYRDQKDDQRSLQCQQMYQQMLDSIVGDQDIGAQRMRIRPARMMYEQRARNPYRRGSRAYDVNGRFDRFEEDW